MTVLPMHVRLELVLEEQQQPYMFLCVELQAIKSEIDQFKTEITKMKKNVGLTHNPKIIPFPKADISPD